MMPRCLNCGAERTADQCEACGLTSAAAEVMLRRRLLALTAVFVLGAVAFLPVSLLYPPLELDGILIFLGVVFFSTLTLAVEVERRARRHAEVEVLKRIYRALVPVPWLLAALLLLNGRFDSAPTLERATWVVGKFSMPGFVRSRRLVVASWRAGRRFERIPVDLDDFTRFERGDAVEVQLREGLVGIPWVVGVFRR